MKFYEALEKLMTRGLSITRSKWKGTHICAIDPLKYPGVAGDENEYIINVDPKVSGGKTRIAGPFDTTKEAQEWLDKKTADLTASWKRYERFIELQALRIATELDHAAQPDLSLKSIETATVDKIVKMTSKRLGTPFLAISTAGRTLEPFTPSHSDIFADDWKVA